MRAKCKCGKEEFILDVDNSLILCKDCYHKRLEEKNGKHN